MGCFGGGRRGPGAVSLMARRDPGGRAVPRPQKPPISGNRYMRENIRFSRVGSQLHLPDISVSCFFRACTELTAGVLFKLLSSRTYISKDMYGRHPRLLRSHFALVSCKRGDAQF